MTFVFQDRVQQANAAGYEVSLVDKQILTAKIRIDLANRDIITQQTLIGQSRDVLDFLQNKYTSAQLYSWMEGTIRSTYYQCYTQTYQLAKMAEKAFQFEQPQQASKTFIQFGYWDASHDGLLAGEQLYLGLKKLEAAYCEKRGYDYEITKHVSLRQLAPIELLRLRETGSCEFSLPEIIFDMDFPGHFMRRIRSVSITMPCIVGPYSSVNATLRLKQHRYRVSPSSAQDGGKVDPTGDTQFKTNDVPITAIAVSGAQNDSGVFEMDFRTDRYMPFEGAGCISTWGLTLPVGLSSFDYSTLSDVILHVRYTSVDGGDELAKAATAAVKAYTSSISSLSQGNGLLAVFDVKNDFATEWTRAVQLADTNAGSQNPPPSVTVALSGLNQRLPFFATNKVINIVEAHLLCNTDLATDLLHVQEKRNGGKTFAFSKEENIGGLGHYSNTGLKNVRLMDWDLTLATSNVPQITRLWMVLRYSLP